MQHEQSNRNCVAYYRRPVMLAAFDLTIRVTLSSRCALTVMADTHESLKWGETWQEVQPPPPPPSLPPCAPLLHSLSLTVSPLFSLSLSISHLISFHLLTRCEESPEMVAMERWELALLLLHAFPLSPSLSDAVPAFPPSSFPASTLSPTSTHRFLRQDRGMRLVGCKQRV